MSSLSVGEINRDLETVALTGQVFQIEGGCIKPSGYAMYHPERGFLSFAFDKGRHYSPAGGRKALQEILDAGGFLNFDNIVWVQRIDVSEPNLRSHLITYVDGNKTTKTHFTEPAYDDRHAYYLFISHVDYLYMKGGVVV